MGKQGTGFGKAAAFALLAMASATAQAEDDSGMSFDSLGVTLTLPIGGHDADSRHWAERLKPSFTLRLRDNLYPDGRLAPLPHCDERCETLPTEVYALEIQPDEIANTLQNLSRDERWHWRFGLSKPRD